MTATRAKRRRSKPKGRLPKIQPLLSADEQAARKAALKVIAQTSRLGRPPKYETAEDLQDAIDGYFQDCEDKGMLPTVAGMQYRIGLYASDIWDDITRRGEDFANVARGTKLRMLDYKFQAAASGAMDRGVFIFDAVNHHNHVNTRTESKSDNRNTNRTEIEAISITLVRPGQIAAPQPEAIEAEIVNPQISANDYSDDSE